MNLKFSKTIASSGKMMAACMLITSLSLSANASANNAEFRAEAAKAALQADKITVTGVVFDENNEPVIGANVTEVGTTNGIITDFDGNFTLNVARVALFKFLTSVTKLKQSRLQALKSLLSTWKLTDNHWTK